MRTSFTAQDAFVLTELYFLSAALHTYCSCFSAKNKEWMLKSGKFIHVDYVLASVCELVGALENWILVPKYWICLENLKHSFVL